MNLTNLTNEQQAILNAYKNSDQNILIQAVAGSGKTSTLVTLLNSTPNLKIIYIAFNKKIQEEVSKKISSSNVSVKTFHGLGLDLIKSRFNKIKVDTNKTERIINSVYPNLQESLKRQVLEHYDYYILTDQLHEDITWGDLEEIKEIFENIKSQSVKDTKNISFTDMLIFPIYFKIGIKTDVLMIDEAQDLNPLQHKFLDIIQFEKLVAVGDTRQAIYGFAGAYSNSIELLSKKYNFQKFSLSVNFRSSKNIIELAKKYNPIIQARNDAPEGVIENISKMDFIKNIKNYASPDTLLICRNNSPLVDIAITFLKENIPFSFPGNNIEKRISSIFYSIKTIKGSQFDFSLMENYVLDYFDTVMKRITDEERLQKIEDLKNVCVSLVQEGHTDFKSLINYIYKIFKTSDKALTISTIHKAKGLEENNVIFYLPELLPNKKAKGEMLLQEYNLIYIAITRAKNKLVCVSETANFK